MTLNHWVAGLIPARRTLLRESGALTFIDRFFELAAMAKLADAQDLGSCAERHGGSSPSRRNKFKKSINENKLTKFGSQYVPENNQYNKLT